MKNRNMIYANQQSGGFFNPNMNNIPTPNNMMPSGFNQNANYMAFGPNVGANGNITTNEDILYNDNWNDFENRLTKLERMYRKLDARISKLESSSNVIEDVTNNYII